MNEKQKNRLAYIIFILMGLSFVVFNVVGYHYNNLMEKDGRYTVAYLNRIRQTTKMGKVLYYSYTVNGKKYRGSEPDIEGISFDFSKNYFVKFPVKHPEFSKILLDYPVPDSIKSPPSEGWKALPK